MTQNLNRSIQLIKSIHQTLDENKFLPVNTALLLAFSGGQDSMALLSVFLQRKNQRRYRIGLCWCNHLWRCDSFYTMHHLMRLAFTLGEPIFFMVEPTTNMVSRFRITEGEARFSLCERPSVTSETPKVKRSPLLSRSESPEVARSGLLSRSESPEVKRVRETFGDKRETPSVKRGGKAGGYSQRVDCPEARSLLTFYASLLCSQGQERVSFFFPFLDSRYTEDVAPFASIASPLISRKARSGLRTRAKREEKSLSFTEEGARNWRYQSCQRIATFHGYRILQVGHTASDRIETGFFNLFRGSGMKGVATIQWNRIFKTVYPKYFYFSNFYASRSDNFEFERCE
jgi:hypothetical protein